MTDVPMSPIASPKRILLVDDFEPWRHWVRSQLTLHNRFQIFEAINGSEAVRKALALKPDLILLDIGLPEMNGIDVAKQLRQQGVAPTIVFLTLDNDADVKNAAIATGASGYLLKTSVARDPIPALEAALGDALSMSVAGGSPDSSYLTESSDSA